MNIFTAQKYEKMIIKNLKVYIYICIYAYISKVHRESKRYILTVRRKVTKYCCI